MLRFCDNHPNIDVRICAMDHLTLMTTMQDVFLYINVEDFCKYLIGKSLLSPIITQD